MTFLCLLDIFYKIAGIATPIIAVVTALYIKKQLPEMVRNRKVVTVGAEIEIFTKLSSKKMEYVKYMVLFMQNNNKINEKYAEEAKIEYLNLLDTVCLYVREEYITKEIFRIQYQNLLSGLIDAFPQHFGANSMYDNIINLNREFKFGKNLIN